MGYLFILFYAAVAAADCAVYIRIVSKKSARTGRIVFATLATVSNLIPLALSALVFFVDDNTPAVMYLSMWLLTIYIISVLPRIAFYPFLPFSGRAATIAGGCLSGLVAGCLIYGLIIGRKDIVIKETEICSDRLPASFDGFRIALFSDLHTGTLLTPEREIRNVTDTINSANADIVVFSGDLITVRHTELNARLLELLSEISAPVYSSIGNHDTGIYVQDTAALPKSANLSQLLDKERSIGWTILDNTTTYIHRGSDSVSLSGISFSDELYEFRHLTDIPDLDISKTYDGVPPEAFNITVSHIPQLWSSIIACGRGDLTLAGHVHGMQMKIRIFGHDISPAELFYKEWSGLYERDGHSLYINDGTGYVGMFIRAGVRPEITVITLKSLKAEQKQSE